jgi:hypothetical protein
LARSTCCHLTLVTKSLLTFLTSLQTFLNFSYHLLPTFC